ncbi:MAG: permease-like cell division protein FtsX [Clostridia bacterium]
MSSAKYLFTEGVTNIKKHGSKSVSTLFVIGATMLILGLFILMYSNVNYLMNTIENEQGLQAFIKDDLTSNNRIDTIKNQIEKIKGVLNVEYMDKEAAFQDAKNMFKGQEYLLDGLLDKSNIFPASFIVKIGDLTQSKNIEKALSEIDGIYKVRYSETTIQSIMSISQVTNIVLVGLGSVMLIVSIFIISNTIKLALNSNQREIFIMRYIGATNKFIRTPFVIEGVFLGLLGAFTSWVIVSLIYITLYAKLPQVSSAIGTYGLIPYSKLWYSVLGINLLLGFLVGYIGSKVSIKKYLKA